MNKEIWKDIPEYEGLYQVSNLGRIKNLKTNYVLKQIKLGFYNVITLKKNNKTKMFKTHRLVAEAFIPNPNDYPVINHKDENKLNNRVDNLEWCTQKYNTNYKDTQKRKGLAQSKAVCKYDKNGNFIESYISIKEASKKNNIKGSHISCVCKNKRHSAYGYIWKYKEG